MKKALSLFMLLIACKPTAAASDATLAPASSSMPVTSAPEPKASADEDPARAVVRRWNDAHAKCDAKALEAVYAEKVSHYGTEMKRDAVVKAKAAAFAAAPDFTQSIGKIELEPGLSSGQTLARFTKTVTQNGKTKDHLAALVIRGDRVEDERDDVDWCRSGDGSGMNDRVVPPFTMSGREAVMRANETKHFKDSQKKHSGLVIDIKGISCPKVCAKPSYECGFHVRTSDLSSTAESNLVEWLYVDPIEKKLWFQAGQTWTSEPLPPAQ